LERPAALERVSRRPAADILYLRRLYAGDYVAFNADVVCGFAGWFLALAEK
jgi:hypothetical protein